MVHPMNSCLRLWSLGLGLLAAGPAIGAEPLPWPDESAPAESVLKKATELIREEAGKSPAASPAITEEKAKGPQPSLAPTEMPADVLQLKPVIVHGTPPALIPPAIRETPAAKFFRTGTIWQGKRSKFWLTGDKGLMFTIFW